MNVTQLFKETVHFCREIYRNKDLLHELTRRDFKQKYAANVMGLAWALLDPIALMLIFWFVFGVGLRGGQNMEIPFVTYLITGLAAYSFFQTTLSQATHSIKAYSFLVKKVDFQISILPIVKILSELSLHMIVIAVALIVLMANGIFPSVYLLQLIYFIFSLSMLLLGLSWFSASINLFFPDINNIIQLILRFGFFLTPIIWSPTMFPDKYVTILKLNPLFYIVQGYRDSMIFGRPFWENWQYGLYYWGFTLACLLLGVIVFKRLRPHFADVV